MAVKGQFRCEPEKKKMEPTTIRAALDRCLRSPPFNKKISICDGINFNEANKALNSYLKHLVSTFKIAGIVPKNPPPC